MTTAIHLVVEALAVFYITLFAAIGWRLWRIHASRDTRFDS